MNLQELLPKLALAALISGLPVQSFAYTPPVPGPTSVTPLNSNGAYFSYSVTDPVTNELITATTPKITVAISWRNQGALLTSRRL